MRETIHLSIPISSAAVEHKPTSLKSSRYGPYTDTFLKTSSALCQTA